LVDSGYQGAQHIEGLNAVVSPKKQKGQDLSVEETNEKQEIGRNRVICENFLGRMKKKF